MRFISRQEDQIDIRVSAEEMVLLHKVLDEVCNNMHLTDDDFQTIFGIFRPEAEELLRQLHNALERLHLIVE